MKRLYKTIFVLIIWDQSQFGAQKTDQKYPVTLL